MVAQVLSRVLLLPLHRQRRTHRQPQDWQRQKLQRQRWQLSSAALQLAT